MSSVTGSKSTARFLTTQAWITALKDLYCRTIATSTTTAPIEPWLDIMLENMKKKLGETIGSEFTTELDVALYVTISNCSHFPQTLTLMNGRDRCALQSYFDNMPADTSHNAGQELALKQYRYDSQGKKDENGVPLPSRILLRRVFGDAKIANGQKMTDDIFSQQASTSLATVMKTMASYTPVGSTHWRLWLLSSIPTKRSHKVRRSHSNTCCEKELNVLDVRELGQALDRHIFTTITR